jgi:hypothetical protein
MSAYENTKPAWVWVIPIHPYCVGYPGVSADLFFSSPEKFREERGRHDLEDTLVEITVPADFKDWDYIPLDY